MIVTPEIVKERCATEIDECLRQIYGPSVSPENIEVDMTDLENITIKVSFNVQIVESDNYIGLSTY